MEIEDKFDVPADYELPKLTGLPGVTEAVGPKSHQLVALYFDTPDLRLAARGITLRRRRGGTDPGWHLKLPKARGVRQEITHPLTRSTKIVPVELADLVLAYTRGAPLVPVAELDTRRSVTTLVNGAGVRLVEVADDRVKGTVFGDASHVERWREVEAELLNGDEKLLGKVGKRLGKAGAAPAASASKLARLLEAAGSVSAPRRAETGPGSAGEVVVGYLTSQVQALLSQDPRVRRSEEEAVHQMRVAARRLRSALKSFKTVVESTGSLQEELKWLGEVLGEARDLEVIRERFAHRLDTLDDPLVVGPVRSRLSSDLLDREHEAYDRIREALGGERYFALLDALDDLVATPVLTKAAGKPAGTLDSVAAKTWRRVTRAYEAAQAIDDLAEREIAMHEVRKAAKRARYTAEALGNKKLAKRAEDVQEVLGTHQDGVVAQERLAAEAAAARLAGEDTFTCGVLTGLERAAAQHAHDEFPRIWDETVAAVADLL
ncbi:CHAD domain-containing protein [Streptosporangium becharense]|uniref:CHAD domain-containing protein n=1 Tax=Streptosporangium becharense TaxID=1816182 RepID=A0A7W9MHD8_9ACTN|nr:CYTH and CHAD domain-containing protein [Streptosporangium becharense]MBB2913347.1 CHAD domain-containing protein [Streptosporangium becharense]MBB5821037.1 CHAD domain-containing protein [Streptosporangium becharense]